MVIVKIFLNLKLDADASKFCICNKICLTLSSNACVSSSSLLILKRVDGRAYTSSWLPNAFPPSSNSGFSNNPSVLMLSFMLLLFLKKSDSLCFWCAIISNPLSPWKCLFSKTIELAYLLNADWISLTLNLFLIACLVSICLTLPSLSASFALFKARLLYSLVFLTVSSFFAKTLDIGLSLLYLNFLSSIIIDFNSLLPRFGISAKSLLNK